MAADRRTLRPMLSERERVTVSLRLQVGAVLVALTVGCTVGPQVNFWRWRRREMLP
jgi:hypothetical protein